MNFFYHVYNKGLYDHIYLFIESVFYKLTILLKHLSEAFSFHVLKIMWQCIKKMKYDTSFE